MKRFVIAAAAAVALGLGSSSRADAQIVYGYSSGYVPQAGGVVTSATYGWPGLSAQNTTTYYSPFFGLYQRQTNYMDVLGNNYSRMNTYNQYLNLGYRTGYYQPSPMYNPYGLYNYYGGYYRRW